MHKHKEEEGDIVTQMIRYIMNQVK